MEVENLKDFFLCRNLGGMKRIAKALIDRVSYDRSPGDTTCLEFRSFRKDRTGLLLRVMADSGRLPPHFPAEVRNDRAAA